MLDYNFVALPKIYKYLSGNELKVFVTMFDEWSQMKNNEGWYYRGWKELRQNTGLSNDGLNNALNGLYSKNLLRKKEYPKKEQRANEYQINMEVVASLSKIPYSENENNPTLKKRDTYSEKKSTSKNKKVNNNIKYKDISTSSNSNYKEKENINNKKIYIKPLVTGTFKGKENNQINSLDMKETTTSKEELISKAISNINLNKSSMYKAKTQSEYDCALEDLKVQLKIIEDNASTEAYKNFRSGLVRWYKKTLPYLKFAKKSQKQKVSTVTKPTEDEMGKLTWFVEGVKVSKSIDEVDKYFGKIDQWFEIAYSKYPKNPIQKIYSVTSDRLTEYKYTNPNVAEWLRMVSDCVQNEQVDILPTQDITIQPEALKVPQIELYQQEHKLSNS